MAKAIDVDTIDKAMVLLNSQVLGWCDERSEYYRGYLDCLRELRQSLELSENQDFENLANQIS